MTNSQYERKLAAAFAELEAAEISRKKYDPLYCRILRRAGCRILPPHYTRNWYVPITEAIGHFCELLAIFVTIQIITTIIFDWPYEEGFISAVMLNLSDFFFDSLLIYFLAFGALTVGFWNYSTQSEARRKHRLSRWEDL